MEILARPSDWTQFDAENLARFLETDTGKRLIPKLVENVPTLHEGGETNRILIRCGEVRAFNQMVEALLLLAHPPAPTPPPVSEYPAPENDAAWNDGQKLSPISN